MTPLLMGRWQTRVFSLFVIGGLWTLLIAPILPGMAGVGAGDRYRAAFGVLLAVAVVGILWDLVYQGLQQFRWEKDWPTLLPLVTGVNEGLVVWLLIGADLVPGADELTGAAFLVHFTTTWIIVWAFTNGPMRVLFPYWRFRGGRFV